MASPYTLVFGQWSPDLQNIGVQMPFQYTATPLPCSDLLNVYYADAAYRSLPAPASIGPTLGVQITNAVNWYDDSTGEEIVFAATANGLYMLEAGAWSAVPIETNSGTTAVGSSMQISLGTPMYISYGIAPTSQSASSTASSYLFPGELVTAPGATAFSWFFTGQTGGSWSMAGRSSSMTPSVSAVANSTTARATLNCNVTINGSVYLVSAPLSYTNSSPAGYAGTLVAGSYSSGGDVITGYDPVHPAGSLSPSVDPNGHTISFLAQEAAGGDTVLALNISGFSADPGAGYFSTLTIGGAVLPSSGAGVTYGYSGGIAGWNWDATNPFTSGDSYAIGLTY